MPYLTKSQSARINGAKSRGPKTEAGRARSSQNALKHGLTSRNLVLPSEDPAEYDDLLRSYLDQFQPAGPVERDLVHEMVSAKWRLDRIALIETELFNAAIGREEDNSDDPLTPVQALTGGFERLCNHPELTVLHRMESRLTRSYSRALRNLLQLQRRPPAKGPALNPGPSENENCKNEPTDLPPTNAFLAAPALTSPSPSIPAQRSEPPETPHTKRASKNQADGMSLEIKQRETEGVVILDLSGPMTLGPSDLALRNALQSTLGAGKKNIVVNLHGVSTIDTAAVGTLALWSQQLRSAGGRLALIDVPHTHAQLHDLLKLDTAFDTYQTELDAVNSFLPGGTVPHYDLLEFLKEEVGNKAANEAENKPA